MEKEDKLSYYKEVNERIYEQLTFAEAKNGVLTGLFTATIFGIASYIFTDIPSWLTIVLGISLSFMFIGLILCIISFIPDARTLKNKRNLYFWGDISKFSSSEEYDEALEDNSLDLSNEIAAQNIQVSRIVKRKNMLFNISINFFITSIIPLHIIGTIIVIIKQLKNK